MFDIPKEVAQVSNTDPDCAIPSSVAELPQDTEIPEGKPYVISFAKYNKNMCELSVLTKNKGTKALTILKEIGMKVFSRSDFQRNNIPTKSIANKGAYKPLYNRLGQDTEVREMFLQGDGRIFYFDIESERALYIVAITENHLETDKVRR